MEKSVLKNAYKCILYNVHTYVHYIMCIHMYIIESFCCITVINKTLYVNYTPIKILLN